jgi:hypothetical protein
MTGTDVMIHLNLLLKRVTVPLVLCKASFCLFQIPRLSLVPCGEGEVEEAALYERLDEVFS